MIGEDTLAFWNRLLMGVDRCQVSLRRLDE